MVVRADLAILAGSFPFPGAGSWGVRDFWVWSGVWCVFLAGVVIRRPVSGVSGGCIGGGVGEVDLCEGEGSGPGGCGWVRAGCARAKGWPHVLVALGGW